MRAAAALLDQEATVDASHLLEVDGVEVRALSRRLPSLTGAEFSVVAVVDEAVLRQPATDYLVQGVLIKVLAAAIALGLSVLYSAKLLWTRRQLDAERHRAERAERLAHELGAYRLTGLIGRGGMVEGARGGSFTAGTPGYMAPEQARGQPLHGRADLYALGCVAWWLLSGRPVFLMTGSASEIVERHVAFAPPPLRSPYGVPFVLDDLIRRCLAKSPAGRPADARSLARALQAVDRRRRTGVVGGAPADGAGGRAPVQRLRTGGRLVQRLARAASTAAHGADRGDRDRRPRRDHRRFDRHHALSRRTLGVGTCGDPVGSYARTR